MAGPSSVSCGSLKITFQEHKAFACDSNLFLKKHPLQSNSTLRQLQKLPPREQRQYLKTLAIKPLSSEPNSKAKYVLVAKNIQTLNLTQSLKQKRKHNNTALIKKQKVFRLHCWRLATVDNKPVLTSVQTIGNNLLTVKVLDPKIPVHDWPTIQVSPDQLAPVFVHTSTTLDELIINLKRSQLLKSTGVETALRRIDRAHFCPTNPYHDCAIDIGKKKLGVCISSPHMHVWAAELLIDHLKSAQACLDVGSGSGYFTALLQYLAPNARVTGIECHGELIHTSCAALQTHYPHLLSTMEFIHERGEKGCPGKTFDAIHVGFMCKKIPNALVDQLAPGGRMLLPVWDGKYSSFDKRCLSGYYTCVDKSLTGVVHVTPLFVCSFVPSLEIDNEARSPIFSENVTPKSPNPSPTASCGPAQAG